MKTLKEDPRAKIAKKALKIAWGFYSFYLLFTFLASYLGGIEPFILGLARWVALGCLFVPMIFVLLLILVVEKAIPDVPLTEESKD